MDSYMVISFIGEGSFGRVFKAKHKESDAVVALKVIRKKGRSPKDLKSLRQECDIQRQLNHPNIIRMIDSFDTESELVVVTEYAEKELHSILAKEGCLNEQQVKKITWDLVSALYYLHSHRVLHRDLKPQNVLLDSSGKAKVCDFGLARIMTNATHILTSIKGTPLYMAPELIDEKPYDHQADLWSLGCIVYELMAGQPPFCTMSIWELVRMIRHRPVQWPSFISMEARSFLQGLLHKNPAKRMSWSEILEHPFVSGHILILPGDVESESSFTKPLTHSQQEAKQMQRNQISTNSKNKKPGSVDIKTGREHDLRNARAGMRVVECVPMSDDDSIRATSAFSARDSLKTDDEDQSQPITAVNAKLLRHEYDVMNNSNLVVCNLEKNIAQLLVSSPKHDSHVNKMHKIDEEKHDTAKADDEIESVRDWPLKVAETENEQLVDTASLNLNNPKSSPKCSSVVSSGLSKSVPPSSKQKILQFPKVKLAFGSGSNKLTKSFKRFSRSFDKNNSDGQLRTSEPHLEVAGYVEKDNEVHPKEMEQFMKDVPINCVKDHVDNDDYVDVEQEVVEEVPNEVELEEWEAFLNSNIDEVIFGDFELLTQMNMVKMIVGEPGSKTLGLRGGRVCAAVAALLALPIVSPSLPPESVREIQNVYVESHVVTNFVIAVCTLAKVKDKNDEENKRRFMAMVRMLELCSWMCVNRDRVVRQVTLAIIKSNAYAIFTKLLTHYSTSTRLAINVVRLLIAILQEVPEYADVVERILFDDKSFNFMDLLERIPDDEFRLSICILIGLLCNHCSIVFSAAMESRWSRKESERLKALFSSPNVMVNNAARIALRKLNYMPFYD